MINLIIVVLVTAFISSIVTWYVMKRRLKESLESLFSMYYKMQKEAKDKEFLGQKMVYVSSKKTDIDMSQGATEAIRNVAFEMNVSLWK